MNFRFKICAREKSDLLQQGDNQISIEFSSVHYLLKRDRLFWGVRLLQLARSEENRLNP